MANDEIHFFDVNKAIPVHPGHVGVYLGNDQGGVLHGGFDNIHTDPEAHISVGIRDGSLDQSHVDGYKSPVQQLRDMGKENGGVVGHPPIDGLPPIVSHKKRVVAKIIFKFFIGVRGHPQGPHLNHLGIEESLGVRFYKLDEGLDKILRFATGGMDENPIPPMDMAKNLRCGRKFPRINLFHLLAHFILYSQDHLKHS